MKAAFLLLLIVFIPHVPLCAAEPIEILAIGDSQTNGRGVAQSSAYPAQLEKLLRSDGYDVVVINSGIDGNRSYQIYSRLVREVNERTRIVIFQESGNDNNPSEGVEYSEKSLAWLQDHRIPCILISTKRVQSNKDARLMAEKYGAVYYGPLKKDIPADSQYVQPGEYLMKKNKIDYHLTALGYGILAKNIEPLVKKIIDENHLGSPRMPAQ